MYIIDTHALLWYLRNSDELSQAAHEIIDNEERIFTSVASLWEIAIKHSIGKLHLDELENLPKIHNDPFDRLIICQARTEFLTIITSDTIIPQYDVRTLW